MAEDPADQVSREDRLQYLVNASPGQLISVHPPTGFWRRLLRFLYRQFKRFAACLASFVSFCVILTCVLMAVWKADDHYQRSLLRMQFHSQDNLALEENEMKITKPGNVDECLSWCLEDRSCMTIVYSAQDTLHECHSYLHTPYHYNFKTYSDNTSQIFLKRSFVSRGVQEHDGLFYVVSLHKFAARNSDDACRLGSDFYHLAVFSLHSFTDQAIALNSYKRNYARTGDSLGILFKYVDAPVSQRTNNTCGKERANQGFALARSGITWDVNQNTVGYLLCQGDPFNMYGDWIYHPSSDYHYLVDHHEETHKGN